MYAKNPKKCSLLIFLCSKMASTCPHFLQPHVDFGLKLAGADLMSIPGLYGFVQVKLHNINS